MYRISFFNTKGGVGKSTLAIMCAQSIAEKGGNVCIIDLDPQKTCLTFNSHCKNHTFDVYKSEKDLKGLAEIGKNYNVIIYDHSPDRSPENLPHVGAHAIVVPFQASGPDMWSTVSAFEALEKRGQPVIKVLNRVDKKRLLSKEMLGDGHVDYVVQERSIYSRVLTEFTTIYTHHGILAKYAHGINDAQKEINGLTDKIVEKIEAGK